MEKIIVRLKKIKEASLLDLVDGKRLVWLMKRVIIEQDKRIEKLEQDLLDLKIINGLK